MFNIRQQYLQWSDKLIRRIADFIISNPTIDSYEYVKGILMAPEKYLSDVRIFNKYRRILYEFRRER